MVCEFALLEGDCGGDARSHAKEGCKRLLVFVHVCSCLLPSLCLLSKQGSTPTPWAQGPQDQIQKWALQTQKTLYF